MKKDKKQTPLEKALENQADMRVESGMMMFGFTPEPPKKMTLVKLDTETLKKKLAEMKESKDS